MPWRDDARNESRVQAGHYAGKIRTDGKKGWRIELFDVPNHKHVELHVGNIARDTEGCVLLGVSVSKMLDPKTGVTQCGVINSRDEIEAVQKAMQTASDNRVSSVMLDIKVNILD